MELPDCENLYLDTIYLDEFERAELIDLLVKEGDQGLDKFLETEAPSVQSKVDQIRKLLEQQSKSIRSRIESKYGEQAEAEELKWREEEEGLGLNKTELDYLDKSDDLLERELEDGLEELLLREELVKLTLAADKQDWKFKRSLFRRIMDGIKNFFLKIWGWVLRVFYWFRAKLKGEEDPVKKWEREMAKKKISVYIPFTDLRNYYNKIESKFGNALLHSPKLQAKVDKQLKMGKHIKANELTMNKQADPDAYVKAAKQVLRESLNKKFIKKKDERDRVDKGIKVKSKKKKKAKKRYESTIEKLRKKREEEMKELEREITRKPKKVLKEAIAKQMEDIGYLKKVGSDDNTAKWEITHNLVERFASLIFAEEIKKLPEVSKTRPGASPVTQGYYEKGSLRTIDEESRMDIVDSMVAARINHPGSRHLEDSDIMVKRDIHGTGVHVVIMFDKSGSMDENKRLDAAKRAVMALYKAIKQHNPQNVVDIVAFDTRAELVSLMDVWDCEPKGFTNTGEAIRVANDLLNESKVDRRMVYLVTDGLPEAYRKGDDFLAGDTDKAMDYALKNIEPMKNYKNLRFILLLMEPEEDVYIDAAKKIAEEIDGKIITTDPQKLATDLLVDYVGY